MGRWRGPNRLWIDLAEDEFEQQSLPKRAARSVLGQRRRASCSGSDARISRAGRGVQAAGDGEIGGRVVLFACMAFLLGWSLLWGAVCGTIAAKRGRNGFGWFVLGFLFSFFSLIILILTPDPRNERQRQAANAGTIGCPRCAERIKATAKVCRFCGHNLETRPTKSAPPIAANINRRSPARGGGEQAP